MNLRTKATKGIFWAAIQKWGNQAISFFVFLILARLLEPDTFGLVAMASVFTAFLQLFLDQGMGEAIIQQQDLTPMHLDTAFWANILVGVVLTFGGMLLSGPIANFYNEPQLKPIITWLSLAFLFTALSSTQRAFFTREFKFKNLAILQLGGNISGGVVGIVAALLGYGAWALVGQSLVNGLVTTLLLWLISDWHPGLHFSKAHFRDLMTFGFNMLGIKVLNFLGTRLDNLLIGYFLGPVALGYYTIAFSLLIRLLDLLRGMTLSVVLPTFSRLQHDLQRFRSTLYKATQLTSFIAFPVFIGIAVLASEIVEAFFGQQWSPSVPVMQVLALAGVVMSVIGFTGTAIVALGKPNRSLYLQILGTTLRVFGFLLMVNYGIVAVAGAFTVSVYVITPFYLWFIHQLLRMNFKEYFSYYVAPLLGSLIMLISILGLKYILGNSVLVYVRLVILIAIGGATYLITILRVAPTLIQQFSELIILIFPGYKSLLRVVNPQPKKMPLK